MENHCAVDAKVHHCLLSSIIEQGFAPTAGEMAAVLDLAADKVTEALSRLAANHGVVLHPNSTAVWVAHPFSLSPTNVWVTTSRGSWWAPCLWCALGIATLIGGDVAIHTRVGGEREALLVGVRHGRVVANQVLVHFSLPPARAWDNVIHYCASVLPFRSESQVRDWCTRHRLPFGALVPIRQVHELAAIWYGGHLDPAWRKWSAAEAQQIFTRVGLTGPFWHLAAADERF